MTTFWSTHCTNAASSNDLVSDLLALHNSSMSVLISSDTSSERSLGHRSLGRFGRVVRWLEVRAKGLCCNLSI